MSKEKSRVNEVHEFLKMLMQRDIELFKLIKAGASKEEIAERIEEIIEKPDVDTLEVHDQAEEAVSYYDRTFLGKDGTSRYRPYGASLFDDQFADKEYKKRFTAKEVEYYRRFLS